MSALDKHSIIYNTGMAVVGKIADGGQNFSDFIVSPCDVSITQDGAALRRVQDVENDQVTTS